ncbi:MAG: hypothetical protein IPL65_05535 [Lewinellaceae bacterium]|nr:hypothetical protein [Lewinellaceae bacterium]
MENQQKTLAAKLGAYTILTGSVCMLAGAGIGIASGADLDTALYANDMKGFLEQALANQNLLIINLSLWITGVILLGAGATMMAMLSEQNAVKSMLVRYNYWIAVPLVVASYMAWLAVVVRLASSVSPEAAAIAESMGWFAVRADWLATVLVLGTGPVLVTAAGSGIWVPNWLRVWSYLALVAGMLNTIAQYFGGLTTYGFLIIPIGMGWMIAAGVVLLRWRK